MGGGGGSSALECGTHSGLALRWTATPITLLAVTVGGDVTGKHTDTKLKLLLLWRGVGYSVRCGGYPL